MATELSEGGQVKKKRSASLEIVTMMFRMLRIKSWAGVCVLETARKKI